jgi:hypothetical protein
MDVTQWRMAFWKRYAAVEMGNFGKRITAVKSGDAFFKVLRP